MTELTAAPRVEWPNGASCAVAFTFDVDAESPLLSVNPELVERRGMMAHQAYGPLVGVPRLLSILSELQLPSTFFVPGYTARRYAAAVRAIVDDGHEIAHHGYLHEPLTGVDVETERRFLRQGFEALADVAGVRPVGYRAPNWEMNWVTPSLLAEEGLLYDSSLMDSDYPYELAVDDGGTSSIVELPISLALDDWGQYCYLPDFSGSGQIEPPSKAIEVWGAEFDGARAEGALWILTNHPFLSGRPGRASALRKFMAQVQAHDDVWVASLADIARHVRTLGLSPRALTRPAL